MSTSYVVTLALAMQSTVVVDVLYLGKSTCPITDSTVVTLVQLTVMVDILCLGKPSCPIFTSELQVITS